MPDIAEYVFFEAVRQGKIIFSNTTYPAGQFFIDYSGIDNADLNKKPIQHTCLHMIGHPVGREPFNPEQRFQDKVTLDAEEFATLQNYGRLNDTSVAVKVADKAKA